MLIINVPTAERLVRFLLGVGVAAYACFALPQPSFALIAMGACVSLTGIVGFCPACALLGRKPRQRP